MSSSQDRSTVGENKPRKRFSAIDALLSSGIHFPMAADEPFDPPIDQIRRRVPGARTVLARCNGEVFLIFTDIGDRRDISLEEAVDALQSEGQRGTLTVACDLPADVNRLGHAVAEIRGYCIVSVNGRFARRDHEAGGAR